MKDHVRLNQLDGLRGICSLMVAIFHFAVSTVFKGTPLPLSFIITQGDLFVDFFFVLSGFVISLNYAGSMATLPNFRNYLRKRFLRLYPLLLYTTIVFFVFELVLSIFFAHLFDTQSFTNLVWQGLDGILFLNSTPVLGPTAGINYTSWSVSAEMISYIVFGICILFFKRWSGVILTALLIASVMFLISLNSYMETYSWGFLRGLICFITGFYTYLVYKKYQNICLSSLWSYALCAVVVAVFYLRQHVELKEVFTLVTIPPIFALLILSFSLNTSRATGLLSNRLFGWLGKISYSLYLNHAILLSIILKMSFSIIKLPATPLSLYIALAVYLASTLVYSHFTYIYIEKKGRKLFSRFIFLKEPPAVAEEHKKYKAA